MYSSCMFYLESVPVSNPEFKGGRLKKLKDKRQQDKDLAPVTSTPLGNSYFKIWKILTRSHEQKSEEEYLRNQIQGFQSPADRRQLPRHLVEVSAAQQRQQDLLKQQGERKHVIKQHPNPFDEKLELKREYSRSRVPSATVINYEPYNSEMSMFGENGDYQDEVQDKGSRSNSIPSFREKSGRKSRMGMHDEEETMNGDISQVTDVTKTYTSPIPRVFSDSKISRSPTTVNRPSNSRQRSSRELLPSSVCSIRSDVNINIPAAEPYINKLMKETSEEIENLTTELRGDIENQKKKMTHEAQKETKKSSKDKVPVPQTNGEAKERNDKKLFEDSCVKSDMNSVSVPEITSICSEQAQKNPAPLRRYATHSNTREFQGMHQLYSLDLQDNNASVGEQYDTYQDDMMPPSYRDGRPPDTPPAGQSRSAKSSSRQVLEAIPTKISLMICRDHHDMQRSTSNFTRNGRPPFYRTHHVKRK